ncbi:amidohydrolase family protein [Chloroflexota bacterium]
MKLIDLEAHFLTSDFANYTRNFIARHMGMMGEQLIDLGEGRLKDMDEAGIDVQVISLFQPPHIQRLDLSEAIKWARSTNEELSLAVKKYPDRFIGLAAIPAQSPKEAVEELKRAVQELGLQGLCLTSNAKEEYFDNEKYWPIFETAEALDVPVYLHPTAPSAAMVGAYAGYEILGGPPHGYANEVSLHVMRLIYSGLFDRYPELKMILGHMGEGLPFWLPRLDFAWLRAMPNRPDIEKKPSEYLKRNFTITTSGMFFQPALICAYLSLGADNIAFGVDYPPESNELAVRFIEEAPICDNDKEKICHSNAEKLFKL